MGRRHVRVARIGKPHGIHGEVTVEVFTNSPETRFVRGNSFTLNAPRHASPLPFGRLTLEEARWNKKILLLKFLEITDRNTAEMLRNAELYASQLDPLDQTEGWYAGDLIGLAVYENNFASKRVGEVVDLITRDAQDLLEVRLLDGHKVLLPFVVEIVPEIDKARAAIVITPPPGLLELNQD